MSCGPVRSFLAQLSIHPSGHTIFRINPNKRTKKTGANHTSIHTPQNATFLAAITNATHSIFIQTPNMNAEPLLSPLLEAVRRGIVVTCYLCLGYNDAGQLLPFQNGTNEMIACRLYGALRTDEEKGRLRIFNYVGKDQTRPVHNRFKRRSCHIKLMIVDEKVAVQGMVLHPSSSIPPSPCPGTNSYRSKEQTDQVADFMPRKWEPRHPILLPQPGNQRPL